MRRHALVDPSISASAENSGGGSMKVRLESMRRRRRWSMHVCAFGRSLKEFDMLCLQQGEDLCLLMPSFVLHAALRWIGSW